MLLCAGLKASCNQKLWIGRNRKRCSKAKNECVCSAVVSGAKLRSEIKPVNPNSNKTMPQQKDGSNRRIFHHIAIALVALFGAGCALLNPPAITSSSTQQLPHLSKRAGPMRVGSLSAV
jgi:hypothetical protein